MQRLRDKGTEEEQHYQRSDETERQRDDGELIRAGAGGARPCQHRAEAEQHKDDEADQPVDQDRQQRGSAAALGCFVDVDAADEVAARGARQEIGEEHAGRKDFRRAEQRQIQPLCAQQHVPAQRFERDVRERAGEGESKNIGPRYQDAQRAEIDDLPVIKQRQQREAAGDSQQVAAGERTARPRRTLLTRRRWGSFRHQSVIEPRYQCHKQKRGFAESSH